MVRFNDKTAIISSQISADDIMPITDLSASSDDKKISLGQIGDFVANNSNVAHKNLDNTNMITDAIFEAPNGIFITDANNQSIIVKNGLRIFIADGRDADNKINTIDYSVAFDITQSIITLANGEYSLFVTASGSLVYTHIDNVFISRTEPEIPSTVSIAYWYDVQTNYWKTSNNQGSTWSNQSICQLGFFVIEDGLVTELKPNTLAYIPNSEYIMVRDLSNITDNGNKYIENKIINTSGFTVYSENVNYKKDQWVIGIIDDVQGVYRSKVDNNKGNSLINQTYWEAVNIGGGKNNLFDFKWVDHQLNDVTWLRADTFSFQDGTVYSDAYQHLVDDIDGKTLQSETVSGITIQYYLADDGHKICPANQESNVISIYSATGVAWYYILDTVNTRFKLPRSKYNKFVTNQILPVKGNGMTLGITDGTHLSGLVSDSAYNLQGRIGNYGSNIGTSYGTQKLTASVSVGVVSDSTKSGIEATYSSTDDSNMKLYFYVGQFSQTATEQTAGLNAELFNGKVDVDSLVEVSVIIDEWSEGTEGYRIWANGYCEQWGYMQTSGESVSYNAVTINFVKTFKDTNYIFSRTTACKSNNATSTFADSNYAYGTKTPSSITCGQNQTTFTDGFDWKATGYLAEGEY